MRSVGVFCGSSRGEDARFANAASTLGNEIATRGLALVYGGASVGLMGLLADAALRAGGKVIGVMPRSLMAAEITHEGLSELRVVDTLFERKALMLERSDAFITLPGGLGTLDELFEVLTLRQLRLHRKPCGLLNVEGYFDPLCAMLDNAVESGFLSAEHRQLVRVGEDSAALLEQLI